MGIDICTKEHMFHYNTDNPSEILLKLKYHQIAFPQSLFLVNKSFWNFLQSTTVWFPCSVLNVWMILWLKWLLSMNELLQDRFLSQRQVCNPISWFISHVFICYNQPQCHNTADSRYVAIPCITTVRGCRYTTVYYLKIFTIDINILNHNSNLALVAELWVSVSCSLWQLCQHFPSWQFEIQFVKDIFFYRNFKDVFSLRSHWQ